MFELLFVILVVLKLTGTIVITWFWVFAPLIPAVITYVLLGIFFVWQARKHKL